MPEGKRCSIVKGELSSGEVAFSGDCHPIGAVTVGKNRDARFNGFIT